MLAEDLRKSVLQAAIQGKLVEQHDSDGNVDELLSTVATERERLIKEKIIKKPKALAPISEQETMFDIPDTWRWVRLGEIGLSNIGLTYKPTDIVEQGIAVLRSNNVKNGAINLNDVIQVSATVKDSLILKQNDILICSRNGSRSLVGKGALIKDIGVGMSFGAFMTVFRSNFNEYVAYFIQSNFFRNQLEGCQTTTINQLTQESLQNIVIPLPPLEEQKRIVAKIGEVMKKIDEYEKLEKELFALKQAFPGDLKKSLLQAAIQGKLVDQYDSDGNVDELIHAINIERDQLIKEKIIKKPKMLSSIEEEEIPFEIPQNWKWVRLNEIMLSITAGGDKPKAFSKEKTEEFHIPIYSNGEKNNGLFGYTDKPTINFKSLTVSGRGTIGFSCIRNEPYVPIVRLIVLNPSKYINLEYIKFVLDALLEQGIGSAVKQLTVPMISPKLIPLPPIEEQQRIVEKLEQLLPLCNELI